jgi:RND family efflux transporter MFP subunit
MLKKLLKKKRFWLITIVLVVVLAVVLIKIFIGRGNNMAYTTEPVHRGSLIQTVNATGQVEPAQDISLNFKTAGRLVFLKANEGELVKAGDILARIDSAGLAAGVDQARANLAAARADLEKIRAGASAEELKVSAEQLKKAQSDLANLKIESANQLDIYQDKNFDALNNTAVTAQISLNTVYNHLINESNVYNLQVTASDLLNNLKSDYVPLKNNLDAAKAFIFQASLSQTRENIISASDNLREVLSNLNDFLDLAYQVADSIIINSNYSQTTKNTIKSEISAQQVTNNTSLTSLQTARANLINYTNSYATQIKAAEDSLAIYQAQYDLKKAGPRNFEVNAAEAKVAQAQAQLNKAVADLSDYSLVAPIDGKVTQVNFDLGEQTNLTEPVIKILSNEKYEIKVDIPESDVAKIKVGDKAIIELDAFGSDHPFAGTLTFVDPAQTIIQDVTYYKTTVSLDPDASLEQIKPGMTADVTITTAKRDDVLYIPQRAVRLKEAVLGEAPSKFVEVLLEGNQLAERMVVVGLRGDNGLVEIISGLSENESVVTFKKENGKKK